MITFFPIISVKLSVFFFVMIRGVQDTTPKYRLSSASLQNATVTLPGAIVFTNLEYPAAPSISRNGNHLNKLL
jgi:hypothetical protein